MLNEKHKRIKKFSHTYHDFEIKPTENFGLFNTVN